MKTIFKIAILMVAANTGNCDDFYSPQKISDVIECKQEGVVAKFIGNLKMYGRTENEAVSESIENFRLDNTSENKKWLSKEVKLIFEMTDYVSPDVIASRFTAICLMAKGYKLSDVLPFL